MQGGAGDRPVTFLEHELRTEQRCAVEVFIRGDGQSGPRERHEFLSVASCCVNEEGVPDVGQNQADRICSFRGKRSSGAVSDETQLGDCSFNLETGLLGDQCGVVEYVRDRSNRHASAPSDVLDAGTVRATVVAIDVWKLVP
jgi:hypothetical protein